MAEYRVELKHVRPLLAEAWALYKERFRTLLLIAALPLVIFLAANLVLLWIPPPLGLPLGFFLVVGGLLVSVLATLATFHALADASLPAGECYRRSYANAFSFVWLSVLGVCLVLGGFVMAVVPMFIFMIWFSFAPLVFFEEGARGLRAFLRSKEYVHGYWWAIALRIFALWALFVLIGLAGSAITRTGGSLAMNAWSRVFQLLATPFALSYLWVLFRELKSARPAPEQVPHRHGFFVFSAILGFVGPLLALTALFFVWLSSGVR